MNPLRALQQYGQSVWLDYIRRSLITSGELRRLVTEDGLRGVTANPTIFEKAIAGSADYDDALRKMLARDRHADARALYEELAVEDIRMAADVLRPVYDETDGADGFVSLEVAPQLAHDTAGTIAEARRLWRAVARPNLMIKVPATPEGIPAIETLLAEGININITLMFSLSHYEAVAYAYIRGLERHSDPSRMASVASFFVSRVDTMVDRALEAIGTPEALALRGKIAIANARMAYRRFQEIFHGEPFAALRRRGARVQRPLWASTGTKNPAYSDVLYVEELIGPETVNTVPPSTLDAFRDHGRVRRTVTEGLEEAEAALARLAKLGVDLDAVGSKLQDEGVTSFATSFDQLMAALVQKRRAIIFGPPERQSLSLGANLVGVQEERLRNWQAADFACRFWRKDPILWSDQPLPELADRLGWVTLPERMQEELDPLVAFGGEVREEGVGHVVLLGMGGSSLAPEVFQQVFGSAPGYPELIVLDSTHPAAVRAVEHRIDLTRALFLVSSKSGTTTETLSFFRYFWGRAQQASCTPGRQFVAITDPATALAQLARERGFRRVFEAPPDVGGRYSALTVFGLVSAALIGIDVHRLLDRAWRMAEASAFCVPVRENPCLTLGAALGELARSGRDKVTFLTSRSLVGLPAWLEQLIAESTGKDGKGIVPVADEPMGSPALYGTDRSFVQIRLEGEKENDVDARLAALESAGHPVARILLADKSDLGQEFFRWEVAVAAAGAVLGIHPFNQPDVELAKELARRAMERGGTATGRQGIEQAPAAQLEELARALETWMADARAGDYVALQAYLAPTPETTAALQSVRLNLRNRLRLATTLGYGPRFLHSTGQLHKGGPSTGLFLQLVDDCREDLPVPESDYTFGALIRAQALGDYQALRQRGRRVLRVNLGSDVAGGLDRFSEALEA
ncbi:MAG: bifunctional transaldolase/phosoglucose isomerase [Acidobacteria bacterium]|nr:bifunctional transaldolase/phosoglucose isomerase [Acidobacteriota bacterium]